MATNDQERTDRECMCGCPRLLSAHGRDEHERSAAYLERVARVCFNCNRRGCAIKCNICRTAFFCSQACFNHSGEKHLAECQEMHDSVVASGGRACFYSCVPAELGEPVHLCTSRNCEIMHGQRIPPDACEICAPCGNAVCKRVWTGGECPRTGPIPERLKAWGGHCYASCPFLDDVTLDSSGAIAVSSFAGQTARSTTANRVSESEAAATLLNQRPAAALSSTSTACQCADQDSVHYV